MALSAAAALTLTPILAQAQAQEGARAQRWEVNVGTRYIEGKSVTFDNGATADIDDTWSFLVGSWYNVSPQLQFGGELGFANIDYRGNATPAVGNPAAGLQVSGTGYTTSLIFGGTYNFFKAPLTPYISANAGWIYTDTGVPDGAANGCWWYPWYGYVCGTYTYTKTWTDFTYGWGLGVRWDVSRGVFLRAGAQQSWWSPGTSQSTPNFISYRAEIGFKM
jgi:hypothetical protein